AEGRVTGCVIRESSGSSVLDAATCRLLVQRARYAPAEDSQGRRTADVAAVAIVWGLPDEPPPTPADPPQPPPEQS
ncbi:MAG TPA: energy transducer TonB, partial [Allosphingosinicella sp.]